MSQHSHHAVADKQPRGDREPAPHDRDADVAEPPAHMPMDIRSAALTLLAVLAAIVILQRAEVMIIPIVLGVLISYALDPIVTRITHLRVPRAVAAAVVVVVVTGAAGALVYGLRGEAAALVEQLPQGARRLRRLLETERPNTTAAIQQVQRA